ncbi:hypothetical protein [Brasilonema sp. UFV-L1]|uniref:hypothetical protein n=1 Tax=Brasilonema sp. UFV-L1 TaxID=2234130 RepID=UPI00145C41E1|nr:hypothetical protein [Brasilonema sp. UFV-L1]NMG09747.1 hypothetical protein [Brasilonema sp. UFV-L1]
MVNDSKSSDFLVSYADFVVGQKIKYLVKGQRFGLTAAIANISRHPLTQKSRGLTRKKMGQPY